MRSFADSSSNRKIWKMIHWNETIGEPRFHQHGSVIFVLNGYANEHAKNQGEEARWVDDEESWKKANGVWINRRGEIRHLLVKEGDKKHGDQFRNWELDPFSVNGRNGVRLIPRFGLLHSIDDAFMGRYAESVSAFSLTREMRKLLEHLQSLDEASIFDCTTVADSTGDKWGTTSGRLANMEGRGFIEKCGDPKQYRPEDEIVRRLKHEKCRELAARTTRQYKKTGSWASLMEKWEEYKKELETDSKAEPYML